jgi:Ca2+-binding RTX toxin-like protein
MGGGTFDGADMVDGGDGFDLVHYETLVGAATPTVVDFLNNAANSGLAKGDQFVSIEEFEGGRGQDIAYGSDEFNVFYASLGNDQYDGRGGQDVYFSWREAPTSGPRVSLEIAFGARAAQLAGLAGISPPAAGSGVAFYQLWDDANNNGNRDAGEVTQQADVLRAVEYFVGGNGDDTIAGSDADEWLSPLYGNDRVNGGGGYDFLTYAFLQNPTAGLEERGVEVDLVAGTAKTWIVEIDPGTFQTVFRETTATVKNIEGVNGSRYGDQLQGDGAGNKMDGLDGDDVLDGRGGKDELEGGVGTDILVGGDQDDILIGGEGRDILDGGAGVDTASYAAAKTSIAVSLLIGEGRVPIIKDVQITAAESIGDALINVENVVGSAFADVILGDDRKNLIEGRAGGDRLSGCGGDDIIYGESDPLSRIADYVPRPDFRDDNIADDCACESEESHDEADGAYDDFIEGGDGADQLFGQRGDDDVCGGNGRDILSGGDGADVLDGEADDDTLDGGIGTDILYGGSGNDKIGGGAGFDIIFGGAGSDSVDYSASGAAVRVNLGEYWLNSGGDASTDLLGQLMEDLANGGDPATILQSAVFLSLMQAIGSDGTEGAFSLAIPDVILGVENVIGSAFADDLTGDATNNALFGGAGSDTMKGLDGNDLLDGGLGSDTMDGGAGDDTYIVERAGDVVIEADAAGGVDTVQSAVSFGFGTQFLDNLVLTGTAAINGSGNALANNLTGNAAANVLDGRGGADTMTGGAGNDTYVIDNVGDRAIEASTTGGTDTVQSAVSFSLGGQFLEKLVLTGSAAINGTGNSLANSLTGNAAANVLVGVEGDDQLFGRAGNDTLNGGSGLDRFQFDSALGAANVDKIVDFSVADDTIMLDRAVFGGIAAGTLASSAFVAGTAAADADDRILYDGGTGKIFYDADGSGAGAAVLFAQVAAGTALTNLDFQAYTAV